MSEGTWTVEKPEWHWAAEYNGPDPCSQCGHEKSVVLLDGNPLCVMCWRKDQDE